MVTSLHTCLLIDSGTFSHQTFYHWIFSPAGHSLYNMTREFDDCSIKFLSHICIFHIDKITLNFISGVRRSIKSFTWPKAWGNPSLGLFVSPSLCVGGRWQPEYKAWGNNSLALSFYHRLSAWPTDESPISKAWGNNSFVSFVHCLPARSID